MTRDERVKEVCYIIANYKTMAYRLDEGAALARELLAGMEEKLLDRARHCHCDPNQIGYTYTLSGMQCTYCGLIRH